MTPELQRQRLMVQYKSYLSILSSKGIEFDSMSDEELKDLDASDLARLVREVKDLARTPN